MSYRATNIEVLVDDDIEAQLAVIDGKMYIHEEDQPENECYEVRPFQTIYSVMPIVVKMRGAKFDMFIGNRVIRIAEKWSELPARFVSKDELNALVFDLSG